MSPVREWEDPMSDLVIETPDPYDGTTTGEHRTIEDGAAVSELPDEFDGHTIITAFEAALPGTANFFSSRSDGGCKVVLAVPQTDEEAAWKLHEMRNCTFRVVIVLEEGASPTDRGE